MYTSCPSCQTLFRLTTQHLSRAGGRTRCGECRLVFNAVDYLFEDLVAAREAQGLGHQASDDLTETAAEPVMPGQAGSDDDDHTPGKIPVVADRWSDGGLGLSSLFSGVAVVFLALLVAGQWVFFNRADLAREPGWRPGLEQFCKYLQCNLPLHVDLSQLELLNRDVRQHPRVEEALLVNATLSNQADFTQPYPVLEVSFSDLGGNTVALRRFRPKEYISDVYAIKQGMQPGEPVPVVLEIKDPGTDAVSYQFGFL